MKGIGRSLLQRVFLLNAAVFVLATLALVITPATISFPVELTEAIVLLLGLAAILVLNAFVVRAALAPLTRLMHVMRTVEPHQPGRRLQATGPDEVRELVDVFNAMLDRLERERHESGRRTLDAQESERRRVARDLHDEVGQLLTGILVRLESTIRRAPPELAGDLRVTQEAAQNAIEHVSRVIRQLRPEALADLGLARSLSALAARLEQQSGLAVSLHIETEAAELGDERALVVYRVAQESLTNAARHAQATRVELTLERAADAVELRIRDDGVGLPEEPALRHGILGMRERALAIGARLTVENRDPTGVEVQLRLPAAP